MDDAVVEEPSAAKPAFVQDVASAYDSHYAGDQDEPNVVIIPLAIILSLAVPVVASELALLSLAGRSRQGVLLRATGTRLPAGQ